MKKDYPILGIVCVLLVLASAGGWCANIYKLFTSGLAIAEWGGMEVLRVVGIFVAPLGAALGFF